ncbi:AMP-binding protein [Desarmillaria tabescens]|uniref:AMP-binding protein n=1 Tax=Armillaria tabescens TaxID=1929756 RepID=A0AA39MXM3_ARMTA|nr:AMP-binding protein [Desarmillaria tabescens]KAK0449839.1 AMP-binding protein [Desarmillaria tabescens]
MPVIRGSRATPHSPMLCVFAFFKNLFTAVAPFLTAWEIPCPWSTLFGGYDFQKSFGTTTLVKHACIHDAFEAISKSFPSDPAIVDHQLDRLSLRVSSFLRTRGVSPRSLVCLIGERSIPHIVAIFGVLRAGAAYVPLDGQLITDDTLRGILADAEPSFTLYSRVFASRNGLLPPQSLCIEDVLELLDEGAIELQPPWKGRGSDKAYIIYTSGTTGEPKGVVVNHSNVTNLLSLSPGNLSIGRGTKVSQLLNIAFDMCAWETLGCLTNGGTLYLRGPQRTDWISVMKKVDVIIATPSILASHDPVDYPNLLADRWAKRATFYNAYGPTEVTIVNTMRKHVPGAPLSVGFPTPNNSIYILDDDLRPVPVGATGIIWSGGHGVTQGYLKRSALTAIKYVPDPYRDESRWMYNTGDLGRLREDGQIEPLGRLDDQVKIKGFRVELDGVTATILRCSEVSSACSLLIEGELWSFYSPETVDPSIIREAVTRIHPSYAVPSKIFPLKCLPLTRNGKTDKVELQRIAATFVTREVD